MRALKQRSGKCFFTRIVTQSKTIEQLAQAHMAATSKAQSEFASVVSKQAEMHAHLLAEPTKERRGC